MNRVEVLSTVGSDGMLHLDVPLSQADAGRTVRVTVELATGPVMAQDEWQAFVARTAGSIADPQFHRHEQGEYEVREALS